MSYEEIREENQIPTGISSAVDNSSSESTLHIHQPAPYPAVLGGQPTKRFRRKLALRLRTLRGFALALIGLVLGYNLGQSGQAQSSGEPRTLEVKHSPDTSTIRPQTLAIFGGNNAGLIFDGILTEIERSKKRSTGELEAIAAVQPLVVEGDKLFKAGQYLEAGVQYKRALKNQPKLLPARLALGVCFLKLDKLDYAIREFKQALELDPHHAETHYNLATYFALTDNRGKSLEHLSEAAKLGVLRETN